MRMKFSLIFLLLVLTVSILQAQTLSVTISGMIKGKADKTALPFVNIVLKTEKDSAFVTGTVSNEEGRFTLANIKSGNYVLQFSYTGFASKSQPVLVGTLSSFLDLGTIELQQDAKQLQITMCLVVEIQNWNLTQLLHSIGNIQSMEFCLEPIIKLTF